CWLPPYHDMGLIGGLLQVVFHGASCWVMSPVAFLQDPFRWLRAISRYGADTSGGPNFAYDFCVQRTTPEQRATLDLRKWSVAAIGSEPVSPQTMERFATAFEASGFRPETFYPCYGLAEATLFVTGGAKAAVPVVRDFDAVELGRRRAVPANLDRRDAGPTSPASPVSLANPTDSTGGTGVPPVRLVGCGHPWLGEEVIVVDPESGRRLPGGAVGEIWVRG